MFNTTRRKIHGQKKRSRSTEAVIVDNRENRGRG